LVPFNRQRNIAAAKYFSHSNTFANQHSQWQSDKSFDSSMRAYSSRQQKPEDIREMKNQQLKERQYRLQTLLRDESSKYAQEAKELRVNGAENSKTFDALKQRMDSIKSAREEDRKRLVEEKLYQHWRENNPDIREIESKRKITTFIFYLFWLIRITIPMNIPYS